MPVPTIVSSRFSYRSPSSSRMACLAHSGCAAAAPYPHYEADSHPVDHVQLVARPAGSSQQADSPGLAVRVHRVVAAGIGRLDVGLF